MSSRCPSCGGTLRFDIPSQMLICENCAGSFDPAKFRQSAAADESTDAQDQTKVFTCPSCGAQVASQDLDAVDYCPYCGTFVTLQSRLERLQKPDYIIPFKITREKCVELYKARLKSSHFLPKDLLGEGALSFRSSFIPFWQYSFTPNGSVTARGEESWIDGNIRYTQLYDIRGEVSGHVADGPLHDASASLEDRITDTIGGFSRSALVPYNPAYMIGSWADIADVDKDTYSDQVAEEAVDAIEPQLRDSLPASSVRSRGNVSLSAVRADGTVTSKLAMLPVWFMTRRDNERVSYAVVNGETGEVFAEVPADIKKFTCSALLLAVPLFVLLQLFLNITPKTMLFAVALLSLIVLVRYTRSYNKGKAAWNRTQDRGYARVFQKSAAPSTLPSYMKGAFGSIASLLLAAACFIYQPVNDLYYYGTAAACILGAVLSIFSSVKLHNLRTSRPVPHFFDKTKVTL